MAKMSRFMPIFCVIIAYLAFPTHAQSCSNYKFASNHVFASCNDLPYLNSFLHWNYDKSSQSVQIAYRHSGASSSRWTAWAINPNSQGMVGSQALVAYQKSDGTMRAYTSPVGSYQTSLEEGDLSFPVSDLSAIYSNNEIIIFATIGVGNLSSKINQVWQEGPLSGDSPSMHPTSGANVQSRGSLDLVSGSVSGAENSKTRKRNIHGLLNAVGWGVMMPMGALFARYLKVFKSADPAWFYVHVTCQTSAYIIGAAGWATGLKLGSDSPGIQYTPHRTIGIILFCFGTLQAFALLVRPNKDHKFRFYWNIYHHSVGYAVIILSIVNIFKGLSILDPEKSWRSAYIGIIVALGIMAAILEAYTWFVVMKRKKSANVEKIPHGGVNGTNRFNGHGGRTEEKV